jgi:hypothetical protein
LRHTVHTRALQRAADVLGDLEALRARLNVPEARLALWLEGYARPPTSVFLQVVDILLDHDLQELAVPSAGSKKAPPSANTPD